VHGVGMLCAPALALSAAAAHGGGARALDVAILLVGVVAVAVEAVVLLGRLSSWAWFGVPASGLGPGWMRVAGQAVAAAGIVISVAVALSGARHGMTVVSMVAVLPPFAVEMTCFWQVYGAERRARGA
jgi:hypothetical protein